MECTLCMRPTFAAYLICIGLVLSVPAFPASNSPLSLPGVDSTATVDIPRYWLAFVAGPRRGLASGAGLLAGGRCPREFVAPPTDRRVGDVI